MGSLIGPPLPALLGGEEGRAWPQRVQIRREVFQIYPVLLQGSISAKRLLKEERFVERNPGMSQNSFLNNVGPHAKLSWTVK